LSHQDDAQVHADAVAQAHGDDHGEDYDYLENDPFFQSVRERINGKTILDLPTKA
jgi:hypothetical protein